MYPTIKTIVVHSQATEGVHASAAMVLFQLNPTFPFAAQEELIKNNKTNNIKIAISFCIKMYRSNILLRKYILQGPFQFKDIVLAVYYLDMTAWQPSHIYNENLDYTACLYQICPYMQCDLGCNGLYHFSFKYHVAPLKYVWSLYFSMLIIVRYGTRVISVDPWIMPGHGDPHVCFPLCLCRSRRTFPQ